MKNIILTQTRSYANLKCSRDFGESCKLDLIQGIPLQVDLQNQNDLTRA